MNDKKTARNDLYFLILYTVLFALSAVLAFRYFPAAGKRMVWKGDGLSQHYVALSYYARWGKAVLRSILAGQPVFPTLNLHMGFGSDLFTTLQYYVIGDPFSLPAVLVPQAYMLDFHDAMILLRMYLAGICFDRYCRTMGHGDLTGNLAGALVYVFSTFALFGMRHPYFLNAMIWFPLLLLGAEHIFRGKKGRLFTLAVFFSCISNFYFFYMLAAMTVVYVVWRALRIHLFPALQGQGAGAEPAAAEAVPQGAGQTEPGIKTAVGAALVRICGLAVRFLGRALLGTAMGACFLLPILFRFAQDPRASEGTTQGILYALSYYAKLPEAFVGFGTDQTLEYWTCMGFGALGLLSVFLLFLNADSGSRRGKRTDGSDERGVRGHAYGSEEDSGGIHTQGSGKDSGASHPVKNGRGGVRGHLDLKIAFLFMLILILLPAGGTALNGFSYPANRWTWAFALLAGYSTAVMLPHLGEISWKKTGILLGLTGLYAGLCLWLGAARSTLAELALAAAVIPAVRGLSFFVSCTRGSVPLAQLARAAARLVPVAAAVLTVAVHAYVEFVPGRENSSIAEYHTDRYIAAMAASDAAGMRSLFGNTPFYRYSGRDLANNFSLLHDVSNTQYYWSLSDGGITQFFAETGQGNGMVHLYDNLDNRTMVDEIAGVKYYKRSDGSLLPFGYEKVEGAHYDNRELFAEDADDPLPVFRFSVYKNRYALPFGFTSGAYITREAYDALSIPERQEALMQGILLEDAGIRESVAEGIGNLTTTETEESTAAETGESAVPETGESVAVETGESAVPETGKTTVGEQEGGLREADLSFSEKRIPYTARAEEGIRIRHRADGKVEILVEDTGKALYLDAEDPEDLSDCEISVLFTGMEYSAVMDAAVDPPTAEAGEKDSISPEAEKKEMSAAKAEQKDLTSVTAEERKLSSSKAEEADFENTEPVEITVTAKRDGETVSTKKISYTLPDNPWKTGRSDFLSCCGYAQGPPDLLRLKFSRRGIYTFRELELIGQPMEEYPEQADALRESGLENPDLHELPDSGATSRITGRITVPETRILCLQIPHLKGLRGFVDGAEQPLLQADTMFSALVLEPGTHEIELRYRTPGLAAGTWISLAAALLFLAEAAVDVFRKRKRKPR